MKATGRGEAVFAVKVLKITTQYPPSVKLEVEGLEHYDFHLGEGETLTVTIPFTIGDSDVVRKIKEVIKELA